MNSEPGIVLSLFSILEHFVIVLIKEECKEKVKFILHSYGISTKMFRISPYGVLTSFSNCKGFSIFHEAMKKDEKSTRSDKKIWPQLNFYSNYRRVNNI